MPSEPLTIQEIKSLYDEDVGKYLDGSKIPRWGSFDRPVVGALLAEVERLRDELDMSDGQ